MPNMKLFGEKIEGLLDDLRLSLNDYFDELNQNRRELPSDSRPAMEVRSNFRTLMAAIALADDPAYRDLEQLPEGMDVDREITRRRLKLEEDEAYRQASNAWPQDIVCIPREQWKDAEMPEMLPVDKVMENIDAKLKERQPVQAHQKESKADLMDGVNLFEEMMANHREGEPFDQEAMLQTFRDLRRKNNVENEQPGDKPKPKSMKDVINMKDLMNREKGPQRTQEEKDAELAQFRQGNAKQREEDGDFYDDAYYDAYEELTPKFPPDMPMEEKEKRILARVAALRAAMKNAPKKAEQEQPEGRFTDEQSANLDKSFVARPPVRKTAAKWIEGYKTELGNRIKNQQRGDNYPAADIARIFAARELSNSVRGKASSLGVEMSERQIADRAAAIMANKSFKDFAAELKKPENLTKVESIFTKKHSHGGELDDLFRDYLTNRPAGKLENDPELKRWMPTVKQRIEALQRQAQKSLKAGKEVYREAVEIITLRTMVGAKRGGEGLNVPVPVRGGKNGAGLSEKVMKGADLPKNREAFDKANGAKYICSGHGGKMIENIAKTAAAPDQPKLQADTTVKDKTVGPPEHKQEQEQPRIPQ